VTRALKTPVVLVAVSLAIAILLSVSLLIVTGARGENALRPISGQPLPPPHELQLRPPQG
jgi:hypothetical protein